MAHLAVWELKMSGGQFPGSVLSCSYVSLLLLGLFGSLRNSKLCLFSSALAQITLFIGYSVNQQYRPVYERVIGYSLAAFFSLIQAGALQLQKKLANDQKLGEQPQKQQATGANMA